MIDKLCTDMINDRSNRIQISIPTLILQTRDKLTCYREDKDIILENYELRGHNIACVELL